MTDFIKEYWNGQAEKHGDSHEASWGDNFAIDLEIQTIGKYIPEGTDVLDVGCANGYSTCRQLEKNLKSITGIDFSEKMIFHANEKRETSKFKDKIRFLIGDIRKLPFDDESFDVVYTTRVLINLPSWEEQKKGICECLRVCRTGGTIIFSEAFWEPLVLLNSLRLLKHLPSLVEHDFNRYLKKHHLESYLKSQKIPFQVDDFSSIYYLGSRFLRELATNPEDYPGYSNPINEIFYRIECDYSGGGMGIQQAYILKKTASFGTSGIKKGEHP